MGLNLQYDPGQTPIDEEEKVDLLIRTISTRGELDELEQANIANAIQWSMTRRFSVENILSMSFVKQLHYKMFSEVWDWAGKFRKSKKNIGVDKFLIEQEIVKLLDDCLFWIEDQVYSEDEIAIRFKYRMVSIHPFPNGNGRHSRICGDILVSQALNRPVFSWGGRTLLHQGDIRNTYLAALHQADQGLIDPLLKFARS